MKVLDHGHVELEEHAGGDLSVVNGARVSFLRQSTSVEDKDKGLIRYLMRERHGTPFEHNYFRFNVKCPIFVAREWQRHRICSYNEQSLRYVTITPEAYVPELSQVRTRVGKAGHYRYEMADGPTGALFVSELWELQKRSAVKYQEYLDRGVAPELSRLFLTVGQYTQFIWTVNARSLMNFLSLRTHETAQLEIRLFANAVEVAFRDVMPVTYEAWVENGRGAP